MMLMMSMNTKPQGRGSSSDRCTAALILLTVIALQSASNVTGVYSRNAAEHSRLYWRVGQRMHP